MRILNVRCEHHGQVANLLGGNRLVVLRGARPAPRGSQVLLRFTLPGDVHLSAGATVRHTLAIGSGSAQGFSGLVVAIHPAQRAACLMALARLRSADEEPATLPVTADAAVIDIEDAPEPAPEDDWTPPPELRTWDPDKSQTGYSVVLRPGRKTENPPLGDGGAVIGRGNRRR
jgi:hypothetical protein